MKVSLILPSLNVAQYIEECLSSVLRQTLDEIEIICVDAGSTDGTYEIIKSYEEKNNSIRVIISERKSYGYQVNLGIRCAQGKYIGIVETDDFVADNMYEKLYHAAEEYQVDYVGANYDSFVEVDGIRRYLSYGSGKKYNYLYQKGEIDNFPAADGVLWKGIYNKAFLKDNQIFLHETPGAAFQDVSFLQLVKWSAHRMVFIEDSLYRYRMDRPDASTKQPQALKNIYQEFLWLEEKTDSLNSIQKQAYYRVMIGLVILWGDFTIRCIGYRRDDDYIDPYMSWFQQTINHAIQLNLFEIEDLRTMEKRKISVLKDSLDSYIGMLYDMDMEKKEQDNDILKQIKGNGVILFGTGTWGKKAFRFLDENRINIVDVCDNNKNLWGRSFGGLLVESPEESVAHNGNCFFIIANQYSRQEMKKQLLELGIQENRIICYHG